MFSFLGERERGEGQRKPHWAVSWCLLLLPECTAGEKGPETNSAFKSAFASFGFARSLK